MFKFAPISDTSQPRAKVVVLLVEDDVLVRAPIANHLRDAGYTVLEATNAIEATEVIASQTAVQLVFTDVNMPGRMDGRSLAEWLAERRPDLPVLITSGDTRIGSTLTIGNRRFIPKPYSFDAIEKHIRELLSDPSTTVSP